MTMNVNARFQKIRQHDSNAQFPFQVDPKFLRNMRFSKKHNKKTYAEKSS
jgi:hypothetical protein